MRRSKSSPMLRPRYSCVGRAKQLWLTTPFAMKSPVPVVMLNIGQRLGPSVRHQDRRVPGYAVGAGMAAASVDVDGVAKRHPRRGRHLVDNGLGVDVEELHAPKHARPDVVLDQLAAVEEDALP